MQDQVVERLEERQQAQGKSMVRADHCKSDAERSVINFHHFSERQAVEYIYIALKAPMRSETIPLTSSLVSVGENRSIKKLCSDNTKIKLNQKCTMSFCKID
jgi:hypothetical protein